MQGDFERLEFLRGQIAEVEAEREPLLEASEQARQLMRPKGIVPEGATFKA